MCIRDRVKRTAPGKGIATFFSGKPRPAAAQKPFEWGGTFDTPDASYKWVSQAVDGAYADPEMMLVAFAAETSVDDLFASELFDDEKAPPVGRGSRPEGRPETAAARARAA